MTGLCLDLPDYRGGIRNCLRSLTGHIWEPFRLPTPKAVRFNLLAVDRISSRQIDHFCLILLQPRIILFLYHATLCAAGFLVEVCQHSQFIIFQYQLHLAIYEFVIPEVVSTIGIVTPQPDSGRDPHPSWMTDPVLGSSYAIRHPNLTSV